MKKAILAINLLGLLMVFSACQKPCEHTYVEEITVPATCTASGTKTYTCSQCNDSYTEEIPMTEHNFGKEFVSKKATCTKAGEKSVKCTACGETKVVGTTPLADHSYSSKVTTAATCTNEGVKTYACKDCSDNYTEIIAKADHNYSSQVISKATCTANGTTKYTCKNCGKNYTETSPATGHNWTAATCTQSKKCSDCGTTSGSALGHNYNNGACSRCGARIEVNVQLPATPLTINDYVFDSLQASCEITNIEVKTGYQDADEIKLTIILTGCLTYTSDDDNAAAIYIYYKLYDSDGVVVVSASVGSGVIVVGDKFKTQTYHYIPFGQTYTLVLYGRDM